MSSNHPRDLYERRFAAVKGVQAGREYYLANCPFYLLPEIFNEIDNYDIPPVERAQRVLNKTRVKSIKQYLLSNTDSYVFSAVTVSIDGDVTFEKAEGSPNVGSLLIRDRARYLINDGQHRISAIIESLKEQRSNEYELLPIIFFNDPGLKMSQQIFTDLNRYTLKPAQSLSILYDTRDPYAEIVRSVAVSVSFFKNYTEFEKTTISNRSVNLFTLNGIYNATKILLGKDLDDVVESTQYACEFWEKLGNNLDEWKQFLKGELASSALRQEYLSGHNLFLNAAAAVTNSAFSAGKRLDDAISVIGNANWKRNNRLWEGRALHNGKITKSNISFILTTNVLKAQLGVELNDKENAAEEEFNRKQMQLG
ncbi:DNA sulfur modification protein DndB [Desulfovibrio oxyclinae]|uniref:DNA sulfur modification protein DndB n=1 Tax=Desulfovibrio oxyclinae TaxID=63560 RepID=UPI0003A0DBAB|nr:DNA sulfur modification protein DndB [Desulfovibrio oxyclinae]